MGTSKNKKKGWLYQDSPWKATEAQLSRSKWKELYRLSYWKISADPRPQMTYSRLSFILFTLVLLSSAWAPFSSRFSFRGNLTGRHHNSRFVSCSPSLKHTRQGAPLSPSVPTETWTHSLLWLAVSCHMFLSEPITLLGCMAPIGRVCFTCAGEGTGVLTAWTGERNVPTTGGVDPNQAKTATVHYHQS